MKILAMAIASTFVGHRKYLHFLRQFLGAMTEFVYDRQID